VACAGLVSWIGYAIWSDRTERIQPPRVQSYVPVPVKIGDETVFIGVGVVDWKVPPRLDAMMDKLVQAELADRKRLEQEQELLRQKQQKQAPKR